MSSPADHPSRADGPPDPAPEGPLAAEAAAAEAATGPGGIAASAGGDASEGGSDAAAGPSPYVYHRHNSMYGYGKRQGDSSGRFRPQYKALILAEQQGLGFDGVASLSEAAAAAHGPWQARLLGRGQLDRETPTETTQCKGAIAALQVCAGLGQALGRPGARRLQLRDGCLLGGKECVGALAPGPRHRRLFISIP